MGMKIFFDTSAIRGKYGGISVYSSSLLKALTTLYHEHEYHFACKTVRHGVWEQYRNEMSRLKLNDVRLQWKRIPGRLDLSCAPLFRKITSFQTNHFDIVHITNNMCFPFSKVSTWKNVILTIHDMLSFQTKFPILHTPEYEYCRKNLPFQAKAARHIITVSEFTKHEICRILHVPENKVTVIYNAPQDVPDAEPFESAESTLQKFQLQRQKYFLAVGSFYPHKNYPTLIKAFQEYTLTEFYGGEKLVLVSNTDTLSSYNELRQLVNANKNILLLEHLPCVDIASLYQHAAGFFQLSFYEGFGIPVIEAMRAGCPVCCTKDSAMSEIGGTSVFPVNPLSIAEIVSAFSLFSGRSDEVRRRTKQGVLLVEKFTWDLAARKTMSVYQAISWKNEAGGL